MSAGTTSRSETFEDKKSMDGYLFADPESVKDLNASSFDKLKFARSEPVESNQATKADPSIAEGIRTLASVQAIIYDVNADTVRLKLKDDIYTVFPKTLFSELGTIAYGQPVVYSIKLDQRGNRFQSFEVDQFAKLAPSSYKDRIKETLAGIKLKNNG